MKNFKSLIAIAELLLFLYSTNKRIFPHSKRNIYLVCSPSEINCPSCRPRVTCLYNSKYLLIADISLSWATIYYLFFDYLKVFFAISIFSTIQRIRNLLVFCLSLQSKEFVSYWWFVLLLPFKLFELIWGSVFYNSMRSFEELFSWKQFYRTQFDNRKSKE